MLAAPWGMLPVQIKGGGQGCEDRTTPEILHAPGVQEGPQSRQSRGDAFIHRCFLSSPPGTGSIREETKLPAIVELMGESLPFYR